MNLSDKFDCKTCKSYLYCDFVKKNPLIPKGKCKDYKACIDSVVQELMDYANEIL
jgi:hypothetical protein